MVLVQRKRRRWGAFITLDGPALIAPIKADPQSAWRQQRPIAWFRTADIQHGWRDERYLLTVTHGNTRRIKLSHIIVP